ncbi:MAG: type I-D CRISPR-associated protein Cas10d/Csc3 [Methanothrix sp.]|jgi:CRISPR-associated protein Csc3|nr:type I-D CRISPR-associated protein Cas10d/Csc3 [Methanothrix sp.]MDD4446086.1 type I-D CRISPR-associated protein Cas10d/Csc3 [Methanothrix sp.]
MNESDKICYLAELGFKIAQPKGYKPHAVERLFRESVKAITELRGVNLSKCDYRATVSGRIQKTIDRMGDDQAFVPGRIGLDAKADEFADYFVDNILNNICEGKPGRLKKMSNSLADGFYSATLSISRRYWDEKNSNKKNQAEMEEIK